MSAKIDRAVERKYLLVLIVTHLTHIVCVVNESDKKGTYSKEFNERV